MRYLLLLVIVFFVGFACINSKTDSTETPEVVIRAWQMCMDKNDMLAAKKMSSASTQKWLDDLNNSFGSDSIQVKTEFVSIQCEIENDKAQCKCTSKINGFNDVYEDIFNLIKEDNRWVIDLDLSENQEYDFTPVTQDSSEIQ